MFPGFVSRSVKGKAKTDTKSIYILPTDSNGLMAETHSGVFVQLLIQAPLGVYLLKMGLHTEFPACSIDLVFRHVGP